MVLRKLCRNGSGILHSPSGAKSFRQWIKNWWFPVLGKMLNSTWIFEGFLVYCKSALPQILMYQKLASHFIKQRISMLIIATCVPSIFMRPRWKLQCISDRSLSVHWLNGCGTALS
jgi:hypothetical protein